MTPIYRHRFALPDKQIGRIYLQHLGPDEYIGRVTEDGKLYRHVPLGRDDYVGKVVGDKFVASGGAAYLLFFASEIE